MKIEQKGFLKSDFQVFYLKDQKVQTYPFHFHDFHKIIIFLKGKVTYIVDGRGYDLKPYDVLMVRNHEIHRPEVDPSIPYERIVIWIHDVTRFEVGEKVDILEFLKKAENRRMNLLRFGADLPENLRFTIEEIKKTFEKDQAYGVEILRKSLFIQFMVYINRKILSERGNSEVLPYAKFDKTIQKAVDFIHAHLKEPLRIDHLAERLFVSKYHLMRKFKQFTGYTVHAFILKKRLIYAKERMKDGKSAYVASVEAGFSDYSTFVRAYKKLFRELPSSSRR